MHSWFAQSGSRPRPWSASRRAALERRCLEGRIYAVPPCRGNAVQYDHGGATIGDLSGTRRLSKPLPHTPPMVPTFMTEEQSDRVAAAYRANYDRLAPITD